MIMQHYNFIIYYGSSDFYKLAYSELEGRKDVRFLTSVLKPRYQFLNKIQRWYNSIKLNSIIKLPFKSLWFPLYFDVKFDNNDPVCLLISGRVLQYDYFVKYLKFLKKKHQQLKIARYYQDIIATQPLKAKPNLNQDLIDLSVSYDREDAKKYGLLYHPTSMSYIRPNKNIKVKTSDVYFVGKVKNRLTEILDAYHILTAAKYTCLFLLMDVPKEQRKDIPGIIYLDHPISYEENIAYVQKSKCLLEILQDGAVGATFRCWEAIIYDKILLTNNESLKKEDFYSDQFISIFDKASNMNVEILKNEKKFCSPYKTARFPSNFLQFLSENLENTKRLSYD